VANSDGSTLTLGRGDSHGSLAHPEPVLVLALETGRPHAGSVRYRLAELTRLTLGRGPERRAELMGSELAIRVPDRWMSSQHARLEPTFGRWTFTDESKNGSLIDGHATKRLLLEHGSLIELGHTLFVYYERLPIEPTVPAILERVPTDGLLATQTLLPAWEVAVTRMHQLAASEISILIEGESGVGKPAIARAIHDQSGRQGAFIQFSCGELPAHLVPGELFGDEDFEGLIRAARGGTLLLDDVGELPAHSQAMLARVLVERRLRPLDGSRAVEVDVRIISTSERDLDDLIAKGGFRQDLMAGLAGFRVAVPPLRERRGDLGLLIGAVHRRLFGAAHPGFEIDAARCLFQYPWPLDLWELEQALAAAQILAGGDLVRIDHLPETVRSGRAPGAPRSLLDEAEQQLHDQVLAAMREHRGNVSAIARALDKDRKQVQRWMKRFGFDPETFR
jgi:transcriptional regulator with AAA-type ATPase domain